MVATIKVGKSHSWDVDVIGEPITDKFWYHDNATVALENTDKLVIDHSDYSSRIAITKAQRRVTSRMH